MDIAIYVITTPDKDDCLFYKIGYHTGTQQQLIDRYKYIGNPIVVYYVRHSKAFDIFEEVKDHLGVGNGRLENSSDWINVDLPSLIKCINTHMEAYYIELRDFNEHKSWGTLSSLQPSGGSSRRLLVS